MRIINFCWDRVLVDTAACVLPTWHSYEREQFLYLGKGERKFDPQNLANNSFVHFGCLPTQ
jgi:hypothetical protein